MLTTSNAGAIARTRASRRSQTTTMRAASRWARRRYQGGRSPAATPVGERVEPVAQIRRSLEARKELVVAREQACLHGGQFWQGASSYMSGGQICTRFIRARVRRQEGRATFGSTKGSRRRDSNPRPPLYEGDSGPATEGSRGRLRARHPCSSELSV